MAEDDAKLTHLANQLAILELVQQMKRIVGFKGTISTDPSKPDGTPRKLMDNTRMTGLGWAPAITLEQGVRLAYEDFKNNQMETA